MEKGIRINIYLRDNGFASRREADELIAAGHVFVNRRRAEKGMLIGDGDKVEMRGVAQKKHEYLAYYKPLGLATQANKGEESVIAQREKKGLFPLGRLDKESEGLLVLTNDRRLTARVLGPDSETEKEYVVHTREPLRKGIPAIFEKGMDTRAFGKLLPAKARLSDSHTIRVTLKEGKRHQLRVMLAELGYTVSGLKRLRFGPVSLGGLKPGESRPLTPAEQKKLVR